MKNKPFYLSKKEVKNLRKNKKQLSKYALKEISERLTNEKFKRPFVGMAQINKLSKHFFKKRKSKNIFTKLYNRFIKGK